MSTLQKFPLTDDPWELNNTIIGLLRQILAALPGGGGGGGLKTIQLGVIVVTVTGANTPTPLSKTPLLFQWGIIQNISNNTTDTITIASSPITKGAILNPPGSAGQAGGSLPLAAPSINMVIDASQIFFTGATSGDQVAFTYF